MSLPARAGVPIRLWVPFFAALLLALAGCQAALPEAEYLAEFQGLKAEFDQTAIAMATRPMGEVPEDGQARTDYLAARAQEGMVPFAGLVRRAEAVRPPDRYRALHQTLVDLIKTFWEKGTEFADAVAQGHRTLLDEAALEQDRAVQAAAERLAQEAQRAGVEVDLGLWMLTAPEKEYKAWYRRILEGHRAAMKAAAARLEEPVTGSEAEQAGRFAETVREDVAPLQGLLEQAQEQAPPERYRAAHAALVGYLEAYVRGALAFAEASEAGTPEEADAALAEARAEASSARECLVEEALQVGLPRLR